MELKDSLKPNATCVIDSSDAISDSNEGNPLGNCTYSLSIGSKIDIMEVSGYAPEAESLEPIKGILARLYADQSDNIFRKQPMPRVSRINSRGRFIIRSIVNGSYRVFALQDADGDYVFNQKSEKVAFSCELVTTTSKPDVRQDTIWVDLSYIEAINQVKYTCLLPDDITLRASTEIQSDRYLIKTECEEPNNFPLFFSYGSKEVPQIKGLNFDAKDAFIMKLNPRGDTLTYWLRDTTPINQDSLEVELKYQVSDSTGQLHLQTDILIALAEQPYAKRLRQAQKCLEEWNKE